LNKNTPRKTDDTPADFIVLGTIVRPHGLKGEVKVSLSCSGLDRLVSCGSLRLVKDGRELKRVSIIRSFMHPDGDAIVRLKEVVGKEEADSLRGWSLAVPASDKEELPEDSFYLDDLVGLKVVTEKGEDLGEVVEVMENLANGVFVIRKGAEERLLPALKSLVKEVDLKGRRMVVELPGEVDAENAD
jgi:16S rRNA processing protein RimM